MRDLEVPTNDLYSFALPKLAEIQQPNNVHFSAAGSQTLGEEVARQIAQHLSSPAASAGDACAADAEAAADAAEEEGFVSLFDGKSLDGWIGSVNGYEAADGVLSSKPQGGGNLYTKDEYGDFHLKFDFRLTPGANNGIGIRAPQGSDAAYSGMEIQVLDDSAEKYAKLQPYQYHGSIYGVVPCKRGHQKPVGEWNSEEIICRGKQVTVILNGTTIVDADIAKASDPKTIDGKNHPGLARDKGHIALCGHGSKVEFRNFRVKELK
ncbi:MAG: DUF1080 domain-containing protein [Planctomycetales bacterium]|nr:DUF1080 domain-containing protein [Planctomycetales bacterium]